METNPESSTCCFAFDIHKHYAVVATVDREGQVLLKSRKVTNEQLSEWATSLLIDEDLVAIESTTNTRYFHCSSERIDYKFLAWFWQLDEG
jgi:hypothetical protein